MTWTLDPLLTWGLFQRGLGVIFFISFTSSATQIIELAGQQSILPVSDKLARLRHDFPTWKRVLYFPTLLWISPGNGMLRLLTIGGMVASLAVVIGGPWSVFALAVCYVFYLSLDLPFSLVLPWDTVLFEMALLGLLLPPTDLLPSLNAAHAPLPAVTWVFRILVFRVMFGFGKLKFIGTTPKDWAYLSGFFVNQPLPGPGGYYAQKLPMWTLRLAVVYMFLVEIPIPFFVFFPGPLSVVAAICTAFLMLGIQLTSNFGYFSVLSMVLCIPLLDNVTPQQLDLANMFAAGQPVIVNGFVLVHTLSALITFPLNSWVAQGWMLWAFWYQLPRIVQVPLKFFQLLHPFRWMHPYGVFPPNTTPAVKISLLLEVTWDERTWVELPFEYAPTNERSPLRMVAPHHPRGEQAVIYDTFGMNYTSLLMTVAGPWDPTTFCMRLPSQVFCQAILRTPPSELFAGTPLAGRSDPPVAARLTTQLLEPVSLEEKRATGRWWKRTYIGPHCAPQRLDPSFADDVYGPPELWHFDNIMWRRRSRLGPLLSRAREGSEDPLSLAIVDSDLTSLDVERFLGEIVPLIGGPERLDLSNLPAVSERLHATFGRRERRAMERVLARLSMVLVARMEPYFHHHGLRPKIPVRSNFHLWMLAQHIVGCGRGAYLKAVAEPLTVVEDHVPNLTVASGLFAFALFRFDQMTFDAQKLRLVQRYFYPHDPAEKQKLHEQLLSEDLSELPPGRQWVMNMARSMAGLHSLMPHMRENFRGPGFHHGYPECYPWFSQEESGKVVVGSYSLPDPDESLAPDIKSLPTSD